MSAGSRVYCAQAYRPVCFADLAFRNGQPTVHMAETFSGVVFEKYPFRS